MYNETLYKNNVFLCIKKIKLKSKIKLLLTTIFVFSFCCLLLIFMLTTFFKPIYVYTDIPEENKFSLFKKIHFFNPYDRNSMYIAFIKKLQERKNRVVLITYGIEPEFLELYNLKANVAGLKDVCLYSYENIKDFREIIENPTNFSSDSLNSFPFIIYSILGFATNSLSITGLPREKIEEIKSFREKLTGPKKRIFIKPRMFVRKLTIDGKKIKILYFSYSDFNYKRKVNIKPEYRIIDGRDYLSFLKGEFIRFL